MTEASDTQPPGEVGDLTALSLRLQPSLQLTLILAVLHAGALLCLLCVALAPILHALLTMLVCASAYRTLRRDARLSSPDAVVELSWLQRGEWRLSMRSGEELHAQLRMDSYAHPKLVFLNFRPSREGRRTVVVLPDMVAPAPALRRLRRRLRGTW